MKLAILAAAFAALVVAPAGAQDTVLADPDVVAEALSHFGYHPEIMTDSDDSTYVSFAVSGSTTRIRFYQCDDARANCKTMLFSYGMNLPDGTTLEKVNEWNSGDLYVLVYADDDMDPIANMTVVTSDAGISQALFGDFLEIWDVKVGDVKDYFDFN